MKEQIQTLIIQNKLRNAIKELKPLQKKKKDKNELILIESRLNDLNTKI